MKHARIALLFLLILSAFISILLFVQYFELSQEIDRLGNMIYGRNEAAIEAAEARMEKSAIEDGLTITLPILVLAFIGLMLSYMKHNVVGVIIVLVALTMFSCGEKELNTIKVEFVGCDVTDHVLIKDWTIEELREERFFVCPSFCSEIKVYHNDSLAYAHLVGTRADGKPTLRSKNRASDEE